MFRLYNQSLVKDKLIDLIGDDSVECDEEMVDHLLFDADIVMNSELYKMVNDTLVVAVSLTTAGGEWYFLS